MQQMRLKFKNLIMMRIIKIKDSNIFQYRKVLEFFISIMDIFHKYNG